MQLINRVIVTIVIGITILLPTNVYSRDVGANASVVADNSYDNAEIDTNFEQSPADPDAIYLPIVADNRQTDLHTQEPGIHTGHTGDEYWAELSKEYEPFDIEAANVQAPTPEEWHEVGSWGEVLEWPHVATAASHLPDGRILTFSAPERDSSPSSPDFTYAAVFDPATNQVTEVNNTFHNSYCPGMAMLPDGQVLVNGGGPKTDQSSYFDASTTQWRAGPDMNAGRWYPTLTALADGSALTALGRVADGSRTPEVWRENGWLKPLEGANMESIINDPSATSRDDKSWYPYLHVAPNGKLFHSGPTPTMHYLETSGSGAFRSLGQRPNDNYFRLWGNVVMYDVGQMLLIGGSREWRRNSPDPGVDQRTFKIDIQNETPVLSLTQPMETVRTNSNSLVLPTGEVIVIGGNTTGWSFSDDGTILATEIWNPQTDEWRTGAEMSVPRNYHSTALLLQDGRIFAGGGGLCGGCPSTHRDAQIYSPPYLFAEDGSAAPRPTIDDAPDAIEVGETFTLVGSDNIDRFNMIRLSATTHHINTDQRLVPAPFTKTASNTYQLNTNDNPNVLLPGYYWIFGVDANGAPSVGYPVRVKVAVNPQRPYGGTPHAIPGRIEMEDYDIPGAAMASFKDWSSGNTGGAYRQDDVDIGDSQDTDGGYTVGWIGGGEWLEYTTNAVGGTYNIKLRVASAHSDPGTIKIKLGNQVLGTVRVPNTGDWYIWQTISLNNITIPEGTEQILRLEMGGGFNVNWIEFMPADDPADAPKILLFSKTAGFRHASIPTALTAIEAMAIENGFEVDKTEDSALFTRASLAQYDAVVFVSTTRDVLNETQQRAFEGYIQTGGGFVGIHAASDTEYDWPWYGRLIGAYFSRHPSIQQATMNVEIDNHPSTEHLGTTWTRTEEWYDFRTNPRGDVNVLLSVDENTYTGGSMGDHPIAWYQEYDGGRVWYTGGGHSGSAFSEPDFMQHILGGLIYAIGARGPSTQYNFDFGTPTSPVQGDWAKISPNTNSDLINWSGAAVDSRDRGATSGVNDINRDLVFSSGASTLNLNIGNGIWKVTMNMGDSLAAHDNMAVKAEGQFINDNIDTAVGQFTYVDRGGPGGTGSFEVAVTDGILNIELSDNGGSDPNWVLTRLSLTWISAAEIAVEIEPTTPTSTANAASFTGVGSGGNNLTYRWDFGDDTITEFSTSATTTHQYQNPGRYFVTLTARDASGVEATTTTYQAIYAPLTAQQPTVSTSILYEDADSGRIWNVNPDNDSVTVINASNNQKLTEITVGTEPRTLAVAPNGTIWVANKGSGTISVIDSGSLNVVQTIALGRGSAPYGLAFAPNGSAAFIALEASGQLLKLNPTTGAELGSADLGQHVRHVSVAHDGQIVYVSRFVTPPVPGEATDSPDLSSSGGEILAVNANTLQTAQVILLEESERFDSPFSARGLPNYLGAVALSPDGLSGWVPSKQDNIERGQLRNGSNLNHDMSIRSISSRIDLQMGAEDHIARIDHDNGGIGSAAAFGPQGIYLFIALEGSREVAVVDAHRKSEIDRIVVGRAPQGLVVSPDGNRLYVHNFMDRTVEVWDLTALITQGAFDLTELATVSSVTNESLSSTVLTGKQFFYDAFDERLAAERYMSCASCHNGGGSDGRVWDFTDSGEGLRNTISLEGHGGPEHGRLHWSANFDEVHDFESQIRDLAGGTGLMSDSDFNATAAPLGASKSGRSTELDALAAYVNSLTTTPASPNRAADGSLTADGEAGRTIFAQQNCASCHGGEGFTDSPTDAQHDIGTIKPSSGQRLGSNLSGIDTPTLRGLWATAPYLHDGSASTLQDAVAAHNDISLSSSRMDQLVAYLNQIDGSEPAPTEGILGDVNCSGAVDVVDALFTMQSTVGIRTDSGGCPLADEAGTLNLSVGDVNASGGVNPVDVVDTLMILQCEVGINNVFCPAQ